MRLRKRLADLVRPAVRKYPSLKRTLESVDGGIDMLRHSAASVFPSIIQPDPRKIYITLTANCNLRCIGCRYGRDFMPGAQLTWPIVRDLLDDAKALGIQGIRLYGGEPLLHKDLCRIIAYARGLG